MLEHRNTGFNLSFAIQNTGISIFYIKSFDYFERTKGLFLFHFVHKMTGSRSTVRIIYLYANKKLIHLSCDLPLM